MNYGDAKPIETKYKGYRFRSRLEARWAVFFDYLRLEWDYEKEGFELPDGRYLPDFWFPKLGHWLEVKGEYPSEKERNLICQLGEATKCPVYLFWGQIKTDHHNDDQDFDLDGVPVGEVFFPGWDNAQCWTICSDCHTVGIRFDGRSDRLPCKAKCYLQPKGPGCPRSDHGDKGRNQDHPILLNAYRKAMSARFEFGECG